MNVKYKWGHELFCNYTIILNKTLLSMFGQSCAVSHLFSISSVGKAASPTTEIEPSPFQHSDQ